MTWYQKICEKAFNKILEVPCKKRARKIIFPFNAPYINFLFSDLLCGYIPVAPVATSSYQRSFFEAIHVPTLIIYGEKDTGLGVTSANHLKDIPTSTSPQILANARHPAYLDQPEDWHLLIYNFMLHLKC